MKLKIGNREKIEKIHEFVENEHILVTINGSKKKSQGKLKISWDKRKYNIPKLVGCSKSNAKREIHNREHIEREEKPHIKNLTLLSSRLKNKKNKKNPELAEGKK